MKKYRESPPASGYGGTCSIGGSFVSDDIADYYLTPYKLGYVPFIKSVHDFVGRENYKFFNLPIANYASSSCDKGTSGGEVVGLSLFSGYGFNNRVGLSLGVVDAGIIVADVLTVVWGEKPVAPASPPSKGISRPTSA